jgi:hypothetical protein
MKLSLLATNCIQSLLRIIWIIGITNQLNTIIHFWLVVYLPLWKYLSVGIIIPNTLKNKKCSTLPPSGFMDKFQHHLQNPHRGSATFKFFSLARLARPSAVDTLHVLPLVVVDMFPQCRRSNARTLHPLTFEWGKILNNQHMGIYGCIICLDILIYGYIILYALIFNPYTSKTMNKNTQNLWGKHLGSGEWGSRS